jgi:hypothetical protein
MRGCFWFNLKQQFSSFAPVRFTRWHLCPTLYYWLNMETEPTYCFFLKGPLPCADRSNIPINAHIQYVFLPALQLSPFSSCARKQSKRIGNRGTRQNPAHVTGGGRGEGGVGKREKMREYYPYFR